MPHFICKKNTKSSPPVSVRCCVYTQVAAVSLLLPSKQKYFFVAEPTPLITSASLGRFKILILREAKRKFYEVLGR